MISVKYRKEENNHSLTVTGHANYAEFDKDIVCSGASSLVVALLGWLENNSEDLAYCNYEVESGNVWLDVEGGERTAVAFELTAIGLMQLADGYPSHVEIDCVGLAD